MLSKATTLIEKLIGLESRLRQPSPSLAFMLMRILLSLVADLYADIL
jgi:hypothetical protein